MHVDDDKLLLADDVDDPARQVEGDDAHTITGAVGHGPENNIFRDLSRRGT